MSAVPKEFLDSQNEYDKTHQYNEKPMPSPKMSKHAQFREWFLKESYEWQRLECSPYYICGEIKKKLEQLPDVAAELEKWLNAETKGILTHISVDKLKNKLKELSK